jgi:hypothetical protein
MKPRPSFQLHPNEHFSVAVVRMYKHIRSLKGSQAPHHPASHYASRIKTKAAMKPLLRLVK